MTKTYTATLALINSIKTRKKIPTLLCQKCKQPIKEKQKVTSTSNRKNAKVYHNKCWEFMHI